MAMIVAEPFRLASASAAAERDSWRYATERRVLHGFGSAVHRRQRSLCLFANMLTSGVVLNIGFGAIYVVPVRRGRIAPAVRTPPGGACSRRLGLGLVSWLTPTLTLTLTLTQP